MTLFTPVMQTVTESSLFRHLPIAEGWIHGVAAGSSMEVL